MHYINEWSRMDDATQFVILLFIAYNISACLLLAWCIKENIKRTIRNKRRY